MVKERAWPVRAMYLLIAAALVISMIIVAAPSHKVSAAPADDVAAEWERVATPTMGGFVLAPDSIIIDYALADGGDVAYAVVYAYNETCIGTPPSTPVSIGDRLLKSINGAATWTDITAALNTTATALGASVSILSLIQVATDWADADFVAVALILNTTTVTPIHVFISTDGGVTFVDTGEVEDTVSLTSIADLAVSEEVASARDIAIGGADATDALVFRCTVTGSTPGAWIDTTNIALYPGWDDYNHPTAFNSTYVLDIIFAPSWTTDKTILVLTANNATGPICDVHLQSGTWGTTKGWNWKSILGIDAVRVKHDVVLPVSLIGFYDFRGIGGITLPKDYSGRNAAGRYAWVWVNYLDDTDPDGPAVGEILRVKNTSVMSVNQQIEGMPWLTNVSYWGYIAEGMALAGLLGSGEYEAASWDVVADCCGGVQVYRNDQITQMDICCLPWDPACKPPTGRLGMAVSYVSDDKAYAVALWGVQSLDEGAWSVSVDVGDIWNQLSLIDTHIDYLSDVAVSPDCNKTMLVSVNLADMAAVCNCTDCTGCDSVWLNAVNLPEAPEYSGYWIRTWCGNLLGINTNDFPNVPERGLLRLNPEETTGDTVYLVDRMTDTVYWNEMETWDCWNLGAAATVPHIVDLAVKNEDTIYALDLAGEVAMSDDYSLGWQVAVDGKVVNGWTIVLKGDDILVGGRVGDIAHSDDSGVTFTALANVATSGLVTGAFDTYFDQNDTIYAALALAGADNGIYLFVIDESAAWAKLDARPYDYTGLVLDRPSPSNPMTSPETGGVLYASYIGHFCSSEWPGADYCVPGCCWETGVARCLAPIVEICCGVGQSEWDYLVVGLTCDTGAELFGMAPQALKICGCLTADSNSRLFAIDGYYAGERSEINDYDMCGGLDGTVWTFEDCYAKKQIDLVSPADSFVVRADPCYCDNVPFTIMWERLCDACSYDIQISLDEDFTQLVDIGLYGTTWHVAPATPLTPSAWLGSWFICEFSYYWRVRAADAETCQWIHSWWSEPQSFTVAPSVGAAAITLVSPVPGATGVAIKNLGFSWDIMATATKFDWVLSTNADLSSPIESKTELTNTAYTCTKTLTYGTSYYWQVTAYNDGSAISASAVGTFTTAAQGAFCCPQCGLCFDTQAELQAHLDAEHPAQPATPYWVWVVIAIGAVLVIVVIVLIFRTRRV